MFSVGLVGLPNAGKSTLFNILTRRSVPAENFPFCTIDPHDGIVEVPDPRVDKLAEIANSKDKIYAKIEFRDIAGLVKNAHQGEGLGNQFLAHIHETDLILMVLRSFYNDDIIHVENRVNPIEDEEILMMELTLHDEKKLENLILRLEKEAKKDSQAMLKIQICEKILTQLTNIQPAKDFIMDASWDEELVEWRKKLGLLTDKPILKLANYNEGGNNFEFASDFKLDIKQESELLDMTEEERKELGVSVDNGLDGMIRACYKKLNLGTFLTCGEMEARAWTFTKGMVAPQCAGKIHTDFAKKFIKAEVVNYDDFVANNGWKVCYENGLVKTMGKTYIFEDGDVTEFKIGG
jgi:GTP-binding protein YchF